MTSQAKRVNAKPSLKIGIVGGGFSGVALAATLCRLADQPVMIHLFEKTGCFAAGEAYGTPFPFHLLNVRAKDMSAFEEDPLHFLHWLTANQAAQAMLDPDISPSEQFVPRVLYHHYLQDVLAEISGAAQATITLVLESAEVIDIERTSHAAILTLADQRQIQVNQVVLALGNHAPSAFPFPVSPQVQTIPNSWDYTALSAIPKTATVLIVGTGLSMVDAVLTLHHQQHQGLVYAVSRHGLLPLPHTEGCVPFDLTALPTPSDLLAFSRFVRTQSQLHMKAGGDWRSVVSALRWHLPALWQQASVTSKKRFLRHLLSYWNIHRHRIHAKLAALLSHLRAIKQLKIMSGRVKRVVNRTVEIQLRHAHDSLHMEVDWLVNCMGPPLKLSAMQQPLVQALLQRGLATPDDLEMGFAVSAVGALKSREGDVSDWLYTLGPPVKGTFWECSAVPDIRKQSLQLARHFCRHE